MPAQLSDQIKTTGSFFHVYNKSIAKEVVFADKEDFATFLAFLKHYLSPPQAHEDSKKTFKIRGKEFHGSPRQPKNHSDQIELIAYCLVPDHFHLLLRETTPGALQFFIRSLGTRYSMYYNKKYARKGSLFEGSYKSVKVDGAFQLPHLTRFIHKHNTDYSSYQDYLNPSKAAWVKPEAVLSLFNSGLNTDFKGSEGYKAFVEDYKLGQEEEKLLEGLIIEKKETHAELIFPVQSPETQRPLEPAATPVAAPAATIPVESISEISDVRINETPKIETIPFKGTKDTHTPDSALPSGIKSILPDILVMSSIFVLLFSMGVRSVWLSSQKNKTTEPAAAPIAVETSPSVIQIPVAAEMVEIQEVKQSTGEVAGTKTEIDEKTGSAVALKIKVSEKIDFVNIRQGPSMDSEKMSKALPGEVFELVSLDLGWCGVKLTDGSIGYISAEYLEKIEGVTK